MGLRPTTLGRVTLEPVPLVRLILRHSSFAAPALGRAAAAVLLLGGAAIAAPAWAEPDAPKTGVQQHAGAASETRPQLDLLPTPKRRRHDDAAVRTRAQGARPAWLKNAAPLPANLAGPLLAIVIDDVGLNIQATNRAVRLPVPVTLAYMAYAEHLPRQVAAARSAGHEILLHVPMETVGDDTDTGPNALLTGLPNEEFARRMKWNLERVEGYVGVSNHMGSRFTADRPGMTALMQELSRRGLMFLDSRTTVNTVGNGVARDAGIPSLRRDVFLDNEPTVASVTARLGEAENLAREKGFAVAIGHPHDWTLEAIEKWLPGAQARGVVLVPLTAILRSRRFASN